MCGDGTAEVIREAERIVWAAGWHLQEQIVLDRTAGIKGLACARLEPHSDVIQLVTYDGAHLGHVRRDSAHGPEEHWVAVLKHQARQVGTFPSAAAVATALALACSKGDGSRRGQGE